MSDFIPVIEDTVRQRVRYPSKSWWILRTNIHICICTYTRNKHLTKKIFQQIFPNMSTPGNQRRSQPKRSEIECNSFSLLIAWKPKVKKRSYMCARSSFLCHPSTITVRVVQPQEQNFGSDCLVDHPKSATSTFFSVSNRLSISKHPLFYVWARSETSLNQGVSIKIKADMIWNNNLAVWLDFYTFPATDRIEIYPRKAFNKWKCILLFGSRTTFTYSESDITERIYG